METDSVSSLTRKTSLDAFLADQDTQSERRAAEDHAAAALVQWWKGRQRIAVLRGKMQAEADAFRQFSATLDQLKSGQVPFEQAVLLLRSQQFGELFQKILQMLPSDRQLRKRNAAARSVRLSSSALLIATYPELALARPDGEDDVLARSWPAKRLRNAARMCYLGWEKFCKDVVTENVSLKTFRSSLLYLRFAIRYFLLAIDGWKKADLERSVKEMQVEYARVLTMLEMASRANDEEAVAQLRDAAGRIKGTIEQMSAGNEGLRNTVMSELEEIEAAVKAGVSAIHPSSPRAAGDTRTAETLEPPASPHTASSPSQDTNRAQSPTPEQMQLLNKLSALSGVSNDKLAHEMVLDPNFTLPPATMARVVLGGQGDDNDLNNRTPQQQQAEAFHRAMLNTIADRLIACTAESTLRRGESPQIDQRVYVAQPDSQPGYYSADVQVVHDDGTIDVVYAADKTKEERVSPDRLRRAEDPIDYQMLLGLLVEQKDRIASLTPSRADMRQQLEDAVDVQLLKGMLENNAMKAQDMLKLQGFLISRVMDLQAPARVEATRQWWESYRQECSSCHTFQQLLPHLPKFFEHMMAYIEEITRDTANYLLSTVAPTLRSIGPDYERKKFDDALAAGKLSEQLTTQWLQKQTSAIDAVNERLAASNLAAVQAEQLRREDAGAVRRVCAIAFADLLQADIRLDTPQAAAQILPETFLFDGIRLARIRDLIDRVSVVSALHLSCKQFLLGRGYSVNGEYDSQFFSRMDVILRRPDPSFDDIFWECVRYVRKGFEDSHAAFSQDDQAQLKQAVKGATEPNNHILQLFMRRCFQLLVRALLGEPTAQQLRQLSLTNAADTIQEMTQQASLLFQHNMRVHIVRYAKIISAHV